MFRSSQIEGIGPGPDFVYVDHTVFHDDDPYDDYFPITYDNYYADDTTTTSNDDSNDDSPMMGKGKGSSKGSMR